MRQSAISNKLLYNQSINYRNKSMSETFHHIFMFLIDKEVVLSYLHP